MQDIDGPLDIIKNDFSVDSAKGMTERRFKSGIQAFIQGLKPGVSRYLFDKNFESLARSR